MATIINNPGNTNEWDSWFNMMLGIAALIVVIALVYFYVLPAMSTTPEKAMNINVRVPMEIPTKTPNSIPAPAPAPSMP